MIWSINWPELCVRRPTHFPNREAARTEDLKPVEITIPIRIPDPTAYFQPPKISITTA
jgi:hypothetical protein